ncbi:MAG: DUF2934 domain-containing protein [Candidatus Acidiferrum sp.]
MAETTTVQRAEEPMRPTTYGSALDQIQDTFNALSRKAYEIFEGNGREFGRDMENQFQAERELLHSVHASVEESDDALAVKAEVPGFTEKEPFAQSNALRFRAPPATHESGHFYFAQTGHSHFAPAQNPGTAGQGMGSVTIQALNFFLQSFLFARVSGSSQSEKQHTVRRRFV